MGFLGEGVQGRGAVEISVATWGVLLPTRVIQLSTGVGSDSDVHQTPDPRSEQSPQQNHVMS
jgi:hypothetical protein